MIRLLLASSNAGKLREYRELAGNSQFDLNLLPNFREIVPFEETGETFAENALGKALYYGRFADELLMAEDSGLVVPALGGAPGVYSARYAGPEGTDADCVRKLLHAMEGKTGADRRARFVCVTASRREGVWSPSFRVSSKEWSPMSCTGYMVSGTILYSCCPISGALRPKSRRTKRTGAATAAKPFAKYRTS